MTTTAGIPNRLAAEKSPYLIQHAHNPVDWFPWSDEAFEKAKREDKPLFLSVGYSTCHWCHVMEKESFEDKEVAAVLNENFVSIKVDREERPDIDTIYMAVCQAMTGSGGWPMTIVMTPDKKPFFAGTYFPKRSTRGMPGLIELMQRIAELWRTDKQELVDSSHQVTDTIEKSMFAHAKGEIPEETMHKAFDHFKQSFDLKYGGFGRAPKFPTPHNLTFLLRYWKMTGQQAALEMVEKTLDSMYLGGIYDHIGFGFSRYSTDKKWLVPHFEKMLYDNALLAWAHQEAYRATGKNHYAKAAEEIFTYVLRDMTSPEGAFYSAEDADSEGEEGKFYLWSPAEVRQVLGEQEGKRFCEAYDITAGGNFEGRNIPNLILTGFVEGFGEARDSLFRERERRVHPFKDDKVLTGWNGLMIAALAYGARTLDKPRLSAAAERAAGFIRKHLTRSDGRLLARYRGGNAANPGFADDYAFLIWGLIELYETTFKQEYLAWAKDLTADLLRLFWDDKHGGLFLYGSDAETLITRPREVYDGATPSGNSVTALNLLRMARLTGAPELEEKAQALIEAFGGTVSQAPAGYTFFLNAVWFGQAPALEVNIIGDPQSDDTQEMIRTVNRHFAPEMTVSVKAPGQKSANMVNAAPWAAEQKAVDGKATAYVCRNMACQEPTTDPHKLAELISRSII